MRLTAWVLELRLVPQQTKAPAKSAMVISCLRVQRYIIKMMVISKLMPITITRKSHFDYEEVQNFRGSSSVFQGSHFSKVRAFFRVL